MFSDETFGKDSFKFIANTLIKTYIYDYSKPIIITFAPAETYFKTREEAVLKSPWGFEFIKYNTDFNIVSFGTLTYNSWYLEDELESYISTINDNFKRFPLRFGYGGSMGGFGVSYFAKKLYLTDILLLNPISTLNSELVPWETRLKDAKKLNWDDKAYDINILEATNVYIVYNPFYKLDRLHAIRYKNATHLKFYGVGHGIPAHLHRAGILKELFFRFIQHKIDLSWFYDIARKRRTLLRYYDHILQEHKQKLTNKRIRIIRHYREKVLLDNFINRKMLYKNLTKDDRASVLKEILIRLGNEDLDLQAIIINKGLEYKPDSHYFKRKVKVRKVN